MAMPNIGTLLKQEIMRLSRREIRAQLQVTRKASAQSRGHIATLKRQVATLERQLALMQRQGPAKSPAAPDNAAATKLRFVAKGLKSHRRRLDLSAADYGRLAGVSAQSIYNWEQGQTSPRPEQLRTIATLRAIGKREARQRLDQFGAQGNGKLRKR
jgi:DNA-binding transcriptional regulator YiaG